ncbi:hypothetical protein [Sphaerospermopsis sp. FACHB-1194]|uniref:hypothetical protein n=1 Tax=Sphaerospermopsis sp. FACHB-1194 TaxID=2692862 RepID=UPI0016802BF0|nr:hypothetical protein [Sphaerospermopsis sp. FACHB-1194]
MNSLFSCKGEAFGQLIINFYHRLFSECFAPTSPVQESGVRINFSPYLPTSSPPQL